MSMDPESLAQRTRRLLSETDLRPKKSRGQSFLIDPSIATRIAEIAVEEGVTGCIEIGAGLGALTEGLVDRAPRVVAIEIEKAFVDALTALFADRPGVDIIEADALEVDLSALASDNASEWAVAGNLPYYAATAMTMRALEARPAFRRVVVMVQREVGERLRATPGAKAYGVLSVAAAYHARRIATVLRVSRGAFHPPPRVDSTVVVLTPRAEPPDEVIDEGLLFATVKAGFGQRRKVLPNALCGARERLDAGRDAVMEALRAAGIDERIRAESLSVEEFIALANALHESGVRQVGPQ